MTIENEIVERIESLNQDQLVELQRFLETLLIKSETRIEKSDTSPKILEGLTRIAIPVDNVIIDRTSIYEDRF